MTFVSKEWVAEELSLSSLLLSTGSKVYSEREAQKGGEVDWKNRSVFALNHNFPSSPKPITALQLLEVALH